jgi:hypothetical protein
MEVQEAGGKAAAREELRGWELTERGDRSVLYWYIL